MIVLKVWISVRQRHSKDHRDCLLQRSSVVLLVELRNLTRRMNGNFEAIVQSADVHNRLNASVKVELKAVVFTGSQNTLGIGVGILCRVSELKLPLEWTLDKLRVFESVESSNEVLNTIRVW
jgi:hypothetical protein